MPDPTTISRLRGLVLSASEIKGLTDWPDALVEDYLNILDNIITLANLLDIEIDQKLEEVPTDFIDGSVPFADSGFLTENNARLMWSVAESILSIGGRIKSEGRIKGTTRVTATPYNILFSDEIIFVDTDLLPITVDLPAGIDGQSHQIINSGKSGNNVTIVPNGLELLNGINATEYLVDAENLILTYESVEGWF